MAKNKLKIEEEVQDIAEPLPTEDSGSIESLIVDAHEASSEEVQDIVESPPEEVTQTIVPEVVTQVVKLICKDTFSAGGKDYVSGDEVDVSSLPEGSLSNRLKFGFVEWK